MAPSQAEPTPVETAPATETIAAPLLAWYAQAGRTLPWRDIDDPYRIWVSEIMLQQTRVDTVLNYYDRFLEQFPTLSALAEATEDQVLAAWAGLGFYRRARNLHRAAKTMISEHQGQVPSDPEALQTLPGIGRYTVGAILSSAHNARLPIVDGNVIRVLSRVFHLAGDPSRSAMQKELWRLAEAILPGDRPGDFNQALMDLGATVCHPVNPRCDTCPLQSLCLANKLGDPEDFPHPTRKTKVVFQQRAALYIRDRDGRMLLTRRPDAGLLASMWELPAVDLQDGEDPAAAVTTLLPSAKRARKIEPIGTVEHRFSHRHWTVHVFAAENPVASSPLDNDQRRWVHPDDLHEIGLPTATWKAVRLGLKLLDAEQRPGESPG